MALSEMEITMLLKTRLPKIKTWLAVGYFDMFCMRKGNFKVARML